MPSMTSRSAVAIVRSAVRYDGILQSLELVQDSFVERLADSMRIVIKPDFFFTKHGMSTSVDAVRAVLDFILEFTNKKITIAEGLYDGGNINKVFHNAQLHELHDDYGIKYVDLNKDEFVTIRLGADALSLASGSSLSVRVAKTIINSDFRISLAVPKILRGNYHSAMANLALGSVISNAKTLAKNDKAKIISSRHSAGAIAEILKVARPSLAVVDGFESVAGKRSLETNFCVASADGVAADAVAAAALGSRLKKKIPKQKYLELCQKAGLGQSSLGKINVVGEKM